MVRPFRIDVAQAELDDLRRRLERARWPDEAPAPHLSELAERWAGGYDWRRHEARLNELPQFTTTIDGQLVHFAHVRSPDPDALPLIVTHGWPGSIVEFLRVVGPLSETFHLVIPSIPGFGFSGPTREAGWDVARVARAWAELMRRLGYERYGAQGGDWGSGISRQLGILEPSRVVGVHVNTLQIAPEVDTVLGGGAGAIPEGLTERERERLDAAARFLADGAGYGILQSTRPQTLSYALTDSPLGQLAWIAEKFHEWSDPRHRPDPDDVLTNVTLYWLTRTAGSSARLYYEEARAARLRAPSPLRVPTAVAVFPYDIGLPVRRLAERDTAIVRWTELDRGGHFAAMEVPDLLVDDIREFFHPLRRP